MHEVLHSLKGALKGGDWEHKAQDSIQAAIFS